MAALQHLIVIELSLTRTLPTELFSLSDWETLQIDEHAIGGSLPTQVGNMLR